MESCCRCSRHQSRSAHPPALSTRRGCVRLASAVWPARSVGGDHRFVKHDSAGCRLPERPRNSQVDAVRKEVREVVQDKSRLVRDDCLRLVLLIPAPKAQSDKVVGSGNGRKPVEAVFDSLEVPDRLVVVEVSITVADLPRVLCGEVAALLVGECGKRVSYEPSRTAHAKTSDLFGVFCRAVGSVASPASGAISTLTPRGRVNADQTKSLGSKKHSPQSPKNSTRRKLLIWRGLLPKAG